MIPVPKILCSDIRLVWLPPVPGYPPCFLNFRKWSLATVPPFLWRFIYIIWSVSIKIIRLSQNMKNIFSTRIIINFYSVFIGCAKKMWKKFSSFVFFLEKLSRTTPLQFIKNSQKGVVEHDIPWLTNVFSHLHKIQIPDRIFMKNFQIISLCELTYFVGNLEPQMKRFLRPTRENVQYPEIRALQGLQIWEVAKKLFSKIKTFFLNFITKWPTLRYDIINKKYVICMSYRSNILSYHSWSILCIKNIENIFNFFYLKNSEKFLKKWAIYEVHITKTCFCGFIWDLHRNFEKFKFWYLK